MYVRSFKYMSCKRALTALTFVNTKRFLSSTFFTAVHRHQSKKHSNFHNNNIELVL